MSQNECGLPKLAGTVSMTKLKNALKRLDDTLVAKLSNVRINGQLQGCSGFVTDPATGRIVYVSTDVNHGTTRQALYRDAAHDRDYTGGSNRFAEMADLPQAVVERLHEQRP